MIGDLDLQIVTNSNYSMSRGINHCDKNPVAFTYTKSPTGFTDNPVICLELKSTTGPLKSFNANHLSGSGKNLLRYGSTDNQEKNNLLYRNFSGNPFLPEDSRQHKIYFDSVLNMAAQGLRKQNILIIHRLSWVCPAVWIVHLHYYSQYAPKILKKAIRYSLCQYAGIRYNRQDF